jgi:hypothetical protein
VLDGGVELDFDALAGDGVAAPTFHGWFDLYTTYPQRHPSNCA